MHSDKFVDERSSNSEKRYLFGIREIRNTRYANCKSQPKYFKKLRIPNFWFEKLPRNVGASHLRIFMKFQSHA